MYVKKFEGESLTETLNMVKKELGPDAIILKTITNKGLKGAFKKNRIEITAAISEQSYINKSKVDKVLGDDLKEQFYNKPAQEINSQINSYNKTSQTNTDSSGYGNMGLNKVVNTVSKASNKFKESLDDFLGSPEESQENFESEDNFNFSQEQGLDDNLAEKSSQTNNLGDIELRSELQSQKNQIQSLERKIAELTIALESRSIDKETTQVGIDELKASLRILDLSESLVQNICKKARFELTREELNEIDVVFEFALRELNEMIQTQMPLFSDIKVDGNPVVTAIVSESSAGQSSMAIKLAVLNDNAKVIRYREGQSLQKQSFAANVFGIDIIDSESLSHMLGDIRKSLSKGESVILDIKTQGQAEDESRKLLETLKRSFEFIEILVGTSAINSEIYNRKILSKFKDFSDGVIITNVDQCMNFGSLLNVHFSNKELPLKFFGTGPTIPDDVEAATAERILTAMFKL